MQVLIQGLGEARCTSGGPCSGRNGCTTSSGASSPACIHGRSGSTSAWCLSVRTPKSTPPYPLQGHPPRVCPDRLHHGPEEKDEDDVVEDEEDDGGDRAPGVEVQHQQLNDAHVEEHYYHRYYYQEQVGAALPALLHPEFDYDYKLQPLPQYHFLPLAPLLFIIFLFVPCSLAASFFGLPLAAFFLGAFGAYCFLALGCSAMVFLGFFCLGGFLR